MNDILKLLFRNVPEDNEESYDKSVTIRSQFQLTLAEYVNSVKVSVSCLVRSTEFY